MTAPTGLPTSCAEHLQHAGRLGAVFVTHRPCVDTQSRTPTTGARTRHHPDWRSSEPDQRPHHRGPLRINNAPVPKETNQSRTDIAGSEIPCPLGPLLSRRRSPIESRYRHRPEFLPVRTNDSGTNPPQLCRLHACRRVGVWILVRACRVEHPAGCPVEAARIPATDKAIRSSSESRIALTGKNANHLGQLS